VKRERGIKMFKVDKTKQSNTMRGATLITVLSIVLAFSAIYVEFSRIEKKEPKTTEIKKINNKLQTVSRVND
jgi:hypothetical protein